MQPREPASPCILQRNIGGTKKQINCVEKESQPTVTKTNSG